MSLGHVGVANDFRKSIKAELRALARSPDYRVLRKLVPRPAFPSSYDERSKTAVILDVETTGLDTSKDEVIELGMVKFDYLPTATFWDCAMPS
jgi:DNA polymerase-3 subunit epsilon